MTPLGVTPGTYDITTAIVPHFKWGREVQERLTLPASQLIGGNARQDPDLPIGQNCLGKDTHALVTLGKRRSSLLGAPPGLRLSRPAPTLALGPELALSENLLKSAS